MKVAYVFSTSGHTASYKLGTMILPQLEQGTHAVEVAHVGCFPDFYAALAGNMPGQVITL